MSKQDKLLQKVNMALMILASTSCSAKQEPVEVDQTKRMYQLHYVQPGETIDSISDLYGMKKNELTTINSLHKPYVLHSGQRLHVHKRKFQDYYKDCKAKSGSCKRP